MEIRKYIKKAIKNRIGEQRLRNMFKQNLFDRTPEEFNVEIINLLREKAEKLELKDALKMLLDLDSKLYFLADEYTVRYGGGSHPKHRFMKYHDFFTDNISKGENVLDIGSSAGELTNDIAKKANPGKVYGIEFDEERYRMSLSNIQSDNLKFEFGDATKDFIDEKFDVITLSNVLEHIEKRPELLSILNKKYKPKRFLIRVPVYQRDWRVPMKEELGLDYRLDDTHYIEYTQEIFAKEMEEAGLKIKHMEIRWCEIWAILESM